MRPPRRRLYLDRCAEILAQIHERIRIPHWRSVKLLSMPVGAIESEHEDG